VHCKFGRWEKNLSDLLSLFFFLKSSSHQLHRPFGAGLICFAAHSRVSAAAAVLPACFCLISARPLLRPAYNYHSYTQYYSSFLQVLLRCQSISYLFDILALLPGLASHLIATCLRLSRAEFHYLRLHLPTIPSTRTYIYYLSSYHIILHQVLCSSLVCGPFSCREKLHFSK
jgi:hypothetical protein